MAVELLMLRAAGGAAVGGTCAETGSEEEVWAASCIWRSTVLACAVQLDSV
jgi:hypothetical protein